MPKSTKSTKPKTRKSRKVVTKVTEPVVVETPVVEPVEKVVEEVEPLVQPVEPIVDIKPKAKRVSRRPSAYNMYVKKMMAKDEVKKLAARQRMVFIGEKWKQEKQQKEKK